MNEKKKMKSLLKEYYGLVDVKLKKNTIGWQNTIYVVESATDHFVLRVTPKQNRQEQHLAGELEWLSQLKKEMSVPFPILTKKLRPFIDLAPKEGPYFYTLFNFLPGKHLDYP